MAKMTICIPTAKFPSTLHETLSSLDSTPFKVIQDNTGCGNCLNKFLELDTDILYFMCDDDILLNTFTLNRVQWYFRTYSNLGVLGRYYYWFDKDPHIPIRFKKSNNIYALSDQISGMAFRRSFMKGKFSNEPFIEMASMVKQTLEHSESLIMPEYTVAVRTTHSGSCNPKVYEISPTLRWVSVVGNQEFVNSNFVGLVQIRIYAGWKKAIKEAFIILRLAPINILDIGWWFFVLVICLPKGLVKWMSYNFKKIWKPKF